MLVCDARLYDRGGHGGGGGGGGVEGPYITRFHPHECATKRATKSHETRHDNPRGVPRKKPRCSSRMDTSPSSLFLCDPRQVT